MGNEHNNDGFTLLEVLVALAILGGSSTAVLLSLSNHRAWQARSEAHLHLAMTAEGVLQRVGLDIPLKDGQVSDGSGDVRWIAAMSPHDAGTDSMNGSRLYKITVTVSSRSSSDRVTLTTLRQVRN
jgi:prepilin-type N-terminal cleavage/methylation domain-containing protein